MDLEIVEYNWNSNKVWQSRVSIMLKKTTQKRDKYINNKYYLAMTAAPFLRKKYIE